jgi:hypothetical protein
MYRPLEHIHNTYCIFRDEFPAVNEQHALISTQARKGAEPALQLETMARLIKQGLTLDTKTQEPDYIRRGVALITNPYMGKVLSQLSRIPAICDSFSTYGIRHMTTHYDLTVSTLGLMFPSTNPTYYIDTVDGP